MVVDSAAPPRWLELEFRVCKNSGKPEHVDKVRVPSLMARSGARTGNSQVRAGRSGLALSAYVLSGHIPDTNFLFD